MNQTQEAPPGEVGSERSDVVAVAPTGALTGALTGVVVRIGGPDDEQALTAMLRGLSPRSGFQRFLAGLGEPKPALVRALLSTGPRRGAVLAVAPDEALGHACWAVDADGMADVGVVVADAWQRHGLGRRLVRTGLHHAGRAGATALHLDVHPDNRWLVRLLRDRLPSAVTRFADGLVQFETPLPLPHRPDPRVHLRPA